MSRDRNTHATIRKGLPPHPYLTRYYDASESARRRRVDTMFDAAARHYDGITAMLSFGSGTWYRKDALRRHGLEPGAGVLDVGCGTGAVALLAQNLVGESGHVIALDPSSGMLDVAREAGVERPIRGLGDKLPFEDNAFDMVTMGYALRHVADLERCFREYHRVVKPGGRILLLEITKPANRLLYWLLRLHLGFVVPFFSRLYSRNRETKELMDYYWDTIEHCVPPDMILEALENAGFKAVRRQVTLGMFSEYVAEK